MLLTVLLIAILFFTSPNSPSVTRAIEASSTEASSTVSYMMSPAIKSSSPLAASAPLSVVSTTAPPSSEASATSS